MKWIYFFFGMLSIAVLACGPGSTAIKDGTLTVRTFIDENGKGIFLETYKPLPNTLILAKWNQHGHMVRQVKLTDQNGQAEFSASYTHFFDVSVVPPCAYYSTSALFRDVTGAEKTEFGFWPVNPEDQLSRVRILLWEDRNADGSPDPTEGVVNEKATLMFKAPGASDGNVYDEDNFVSESKGGWFDANLGNSCGTVYVLLLNNTLMTSSVSDPGIISDAGAHGNTTYASIEIPYKPGETTVYWEIGSK